MLVMRNSHRAGNVTSLPATLQYYDLRELKISATTNWFFLSRRQWPEKARNVMAAVAWTRHALTRKSPALPDRRSLLQPVKRNQVILSAHKGLWKSKHFPGKPLAKSTFWLTFSNEAQLLCSYRPISGPVYLTTTTYRLHGPCDHRIK